MSNINEKVLFKEKFVIQCKRCGSNNVSFEFYQGFICGDGSGDTGTLETRCLDCGNLFSTESEVLE